MEPTTTLSLAEIVADIAANGGGTYSVYSDGIVRENLTTGYMVPKIDREYLFVADNFAQYGEQYLRDYIAANSDMLYSRGFFLGAWVNNGFVYLDVSAFYSAQEAAEYAARQNMQIAYYANAEQSAITI